jgi:hypothetical protein
LRIERRQRHRQRGVDLGDGRANRGERRIAAPSHFHIERPAIRIPIPEMEIHLLSLGVAKIAKTDVLDDADELDVGDRVRPIAEAEAITDRTSVLEVSAREAFVDDRRSIVGAGPGRPDVGFAELATGHDRSAQSREKSGPDAHASDGAIGDEALVGLDGQSRRGRAALEDAGVPPRRARISGTSCNLRTPRASRARRLPANTRSWAD